MLQIPVYDNTNVNMISMFDRLMAVKHNILDITKEQYEKMEPIDKNNTIRCLNTLACDCTGNTMGIANKKRVPYYKKIEELTGKKYF